MQKEKIRRIREELNRIGKFVASCCLIILANMMITERINFYARRGNIVLSTFFSPFSRAKSRGNDVIFFRKFHLPDISIGVVSLINAITKANNLRSPVFLLGNVSRSRALLINARV